MMQTVWPDEIEKLPTHGDMRVVQIRAKYGPTFSIWIPKRRDWARGKGGRRRAYSTCYTACEALESRRGEFLRLPREERRARRQKRRGRSARRARVSVRPVKDVPSGSFWRPPGVPPMSTWERADQGLRFHGDATFPMRVTITDATLPREAGDGAPDVLIAQYLYEQNRDAILEAILPFFRGGYVEIPNEEVPGQVGGEPRGTYRRTSEDLVDLRTKGNKTSFNLDVSLTTYR